MLVGGGRRLTDSELGDRDEDAGHDPVDPRAGRPAEAEAADGEADAAERARVEADLGHGDALAADEGLLKEALLDVEVPEPAEERAEEARDEDSSSLPDREAIRLLEDVRDGAREEEDLEEGERARVRDGRAKVTRRKLKERARTMPQAKAR